MPLRPIVSEFADSQGARDREVLERRIAELEAKIERLENAISVQASGDVSIQGSRLILSARDMAVECPNSRFTGIVRTDTLIANSVVGSSYTPGAGNTM